MFWVINLRVSAHELFKRKAVRMSVVVIDYLDKSCNQNTDLRNPADWDRLN